MEEYKVKVMKEYKEWFNMLANGSSEEAIDQLINPVPKPISQDKIPDKTPVLESGGDGILGFFSSTKGHFEATIEVLEKIEDNASQPLFRNIEVIKSIARASRLADLLYYNDLRYHAQSNVDEEYYPIDQEQDKNKFQKLLKENINAAIEALKNKDYEKFFFCFGITLHMVQDLATHQGMTNPEHAFLNSKGDSPDKSKERFELAKKASYFLIETFFLTSIKENENFINSVPPVEWGKFETVANFVNAFGGYLNFDFNCLKNREDGKKIVRWFRWVEGNSDENAMQQIQQIIQPDKVMASSKSLEKKIQMAAMTTNSTIFFSSRWEIIQDHPIIAGGGLTIFYDPYRMQELYNAEKAEARTIEMIYCEYQFADEEQVRVTGGFVTSLIPLTYTFYIPPKARELIVWFRGSKEDYHDIYDSQYGKNYHFPISCS